MAKPERKARGAPFGEWRSGAKFKKENQIALWAKFYRTTINRKMQIKLFTIPLFDSGQMESEMNRFLRGNKIVSLESHLINHENSSYWSFCVRYMEGQTRNTNVAGEAKVQVKKDYKTILSEAHFEIFSVLRKFRKELATEEAVPAFAIFTDEELANIVQLPEITLGNIQHIKGIGEKRVAKYGEKLMAFWETQKPEQI